MRKPLGMGVLLGLLALAFAAVPALAQATVTLHEGSAGGKALKTGAGVTGASSNLVFTTVGGGELKCTTSAVNGEVTANTANPAKIKVNTASFTGGGGVAPRCPTTLPSPLGGNLEAEIFPTGLPWFIEFFEDGTTIITGTPVVDFEAILYIPGTNTVAAVCDYASAAVGDTFGFNVPLVDKITEQEFTTANEGCPASGKLNGEFTVKTSGGATIVATVP